MKKGANEMGEIKEIKGVRRNHIVNKKRYAAFTNYVSPVENEVTLLDEKEEEKKHKYQKVEEFDNDLQSQTKKTLFMLSINKRLEELFKSFFV